MQGDVADIVGVQGQRLFDQAVALRLVGLDLDAVGQVIQLGVAVGAEVPLALCTRR